jgi:hypothetical protein
MKPNCRGIRPCMPTLRRRKVQYRCPAPIRAEIRAGENSAGTGGAIRARHTENRTLRFRCHLCVSFPRGTFDSLKGPSGEAIGTLQGPYWGSGGTPGGVWGALIFLFFVIFLNLGGECRGEEITGPKNSGALSFIDQAAKTAWSDERRHLRRDSSVSAEITAPRAPKVRSAVRASVRNGKTRWRE